MFRYNETDWFPRGRVITIPIPAGAVDNNLGFGWSMDMDGAGDRLVIGARSYPFGINTDDSPGLVQVYDYDDNIQDWTLFEGNIFGLEGLGDEFG